MDSQHAPFGRVREIFDRALELPSAQRAAFVAASSGGDDALAAEVLSLLAAMEAKPDLLEQPAIVAAIGDIPAESPGEAGGAVDRRVGSYRLLRCIGEGGMGAVYEAVRADEQFEKRVAVKLVRAGLAGDAVQRRFRRERQILAQLDHPGIARLLDGGVTDRSGRRGHRGGEAVARKRRGAPSASGALSRRRRLARARRPRRPAHGRGAPGRGPDRGWLS